MPAFTGRVVFDQVSFAYRPSEAVVKNVSFTAEAGKMIALVGPSGGGKSTLISSWRGSTIPPRGAS